MVVVDSNKRNGGLAMFWKRGVNVSLRWKGRYHIDVDVQEENGTKWRLTGIYGESKAGEKENTWKLLRNLHAQSELPWMVLGDFNEILFAGEKEGGPAQAQGAMEAFRRTLEQCELADLGFVGDPFMWRNNWHLADGYIRERLDRAVANAAWRCLFPLYRVINGDPRHSDHRPIIVELNEQSSPLEGRGGGEKCFRFEASWLQEEGCEGVVEEAWNRAFEEGAEGAYEGLKKISGSLATWDREVLGELKHRIKRAKKELEAYRRKEINQHNINKERLLKYKLSHLEDQYNIFWQQRARANWLKNGDRNTSFFHAHASERRKVNRIKKLRREGGGVVEREEEIGPFITNFYKSLFLSSAGQVNEDLLQFVPKSVTSAMNDHLNSPYTVEEVRKALDSIGDLKAPGPDGMLALFYKKILAHLGG
ncbi:uncharacterized protein [Lolium perenne]|uniref:uncharacterized protein n=1 Tax=Lolium perenne TaxID=4522 RepID=UPI003A99709C